MISPRFLIYLFVIGIALFFGIVNFSKLRIHFRILTLFFGLNLISEILSRIIGSLFENSMPVYHFLIPLEFVFFGLFYWFAFEKSSKSILLITVIGIIASFLNSTLLQSLFKFPTYSFLLLLLFLISLALLHFRHKALNPDNSKFSEDPVFWVNIAGLLFYSTTLFFFGFKNIFNFKSVIFDWLVYGITVSTYLLYFYALILEKRRAL